MATTCVLVHGAWHGAWCFDRVVAQLTDAGVPAVAVDLPGHGVDPGPLTDLHGDAARVRQVLDGLAADGHDVVLLGHSYGGAVITEAGAHPAVRHLVYLCAFAVDETESVSDAAAAEADAAAIDHTGRPDLTQAFIMGDDGTVTLDPALAATCFYLDCDEPTTTWALGNLGAQPLAGFMQQPEVVAWRDRPSTYVVCAHDMAMHPDLQRILARRCTTVVEWEGGHSPVAAQPARVAQLLRQLAG